MMNNGPPFLKQYYKMVKLKIITTNIPQADMIDKNTYASALLYVCIYFFINI